MKIYDYIIVGGGLLGNYTLNTLNTENFLFIDDNQQLNSHTFSSITDIIKYNKFPNIEWLFFSKIFFTKSLTNKVITPQIKSQIKYLSILNYLKYFLNLKFHFHFLFLFYLKVYLNLFPIF